mmetsp:Transcript_84/g.140  ORF Transcript_84/g.140 Transcript_84/m.140 type:complete len:276 (-) Transcript_84:125-952(-)
MDPEIQQASDALLASDPDLQEEHTIRPSSSSSSGCPFASQHSREPSLPYQFIPLKSGSHKVSEGTKRLMEEEVSFDDLKTMTHAFYQLAFQDDTLDKFIRSHSDPHGDRFAKWIHQKLSGSDLWDQDRQTRNLSPVTVANDRIVIVRDRTSAHSAAWWSPKRPADQVGRRFQLDECRVWMRLHFWAMRQAGLVEKSPSFADYYVKFIGHFVSVYEKRATKFARESFRWSADPKNTEAYIQGGRIMKDVLGVKHTEAKNTLPEEEVDYEWPHHQLP